MRMTLRLPAFFTVSLLGLSFLCGSVAGAEIISFQPSSTHADGYVADNGRYDVATSQWLPRDGIPDTIEVGRDSFLASLHGPGASPNMPQDVRGVVEFSTAALLGRTDILRATLILMDNNPYGEDAANLYGYEGNGTVDLSDYYQTGNWLGLSPTAPLDRKFIFDVTAHLQRHPAAYLGFLFVDPTFNTPIPGPSCCGMVRFVSYDDVGFGMPNGSLMTPEMLPTLTVEFGPSAPVPEPSNLLLLGTGLAGLGGVAWKRHRRG